MRLIKPSYKIIEQEPGINGIYKMIEHAGRVCYKSEEKVTENSVKPFVDRMTRSGHGAMLEHGTIYLKNENSCDGELRKYSDNKYSTYKSVYIGKRECQDDTDYYYSEYVTTNYRVLVENGWLDDLKYMMMRD